MNKAAIFGLLIAGVVSANPPEAVEFFEKKVRPVLANNCFACHTASKMGGLRLDSREAILAGGKSGAAIEPGAPERSLLLAVVEGRHERLKMPPQGSLSAEDVRTLQQWIAAGALWPEPASAPRTANHGPALTPEQRAFWSFQPVRRPTPPQVKNESWIRTPVDRFILARLEQEGLRPVQTADRRTLIRRMSFDLLGLPPSPEDLDAFVNDSAPGALDRLIEKLLASPHYGERWGRHWLDLARYSDGRIGASEDTPFENAYRYRDWVVQAFNDDMPYDTFVKAQIAADFFPEPDRGKLLAGLGFQVVGPGPDDRVDVTSRVFLGLTVGCAQCHDHKFDPIPTQDYYSLLGIFKSSKDDQHPLAPEAEVSAYRKAKAEIAEKEEVLKDWLVRQSDELALMLARQTARYVESAWRVMTGHPSSDVTAAAGLDRETLDRWVAFLSDRDKEYDFLNPWFAMLDRAGEPAKADVEDVGRLAREIQTLALAIFAEKAEIDDRNYVKLGGAKGVKDEATRQYANLDFLEPRKYYFWRDLATSPYRRDAFEHNGGIYYYGPKEIVRWLPGIWAQHLKESREEIERLKKELPPAYPFLHILKDAEKPADVHVAVRGDAKNPGELAPRRFLRVLCDGDPPRFEQGSGRWELAQAIASRDNPLTARVMANRVWQWHFGEGIVRSPSNFGQLGERPTHPDLLDYLASQLMNSGWSIKALHREILRSHTYQLSIAQDATNAARDPGNHLYWRANPRLRLDVEALRDSVLAVAGTLDPTIGGPPAPLTDSFRRRTIYAKIGRTKPDPTLSLFDFPDPNASAEQRNLTVGPMQRLYFLNSTFIAEQSAALAARLAALADNDEGRIRAAYLLLFGREPDEEELKLGLEFVAPGERQWPQYAQALLSSAEFSSVP
ncbi:MAG: PSD1 and planctomycete cytochrome C domain-containing protein [Bryobacteraceae bacterium]